MLVNCRPKYVAPFASKDWKDCMVLHGPWHSLQHHALKKRHTVAEEGCSDSVSIQGLM